MRDITDAERIGWQMQAATLLTRLLDYAAKAGLPAITWTIAQAGSGLHGECLALPGTLRREHLGSWRAAVTAASGQEPDQDRETTTPGGATRLVAQWNEVPLRPGTRYPAVRVTLSASIWPDDEDEG